MTVIRKGLTWGLLAYSMTVLAVTAFAIFKPIRSTADFAPADVIVVLGAGMDRDGTLHQSTELRVARAVALWEADVAPRLLMSGGTAEDGGPSAADGMAALARSLGVPEQAVLTETRSRSTLQNALFSLPLLEGTDRLVLVTEGFHLPRALASFRWAGSGHEITLAQSTRFRWSTDTPVRSALSLLFREAAACWFNLARAAAFSVAGMVGVPADTRTGWLA